MELKLLENSGERDREIKRIGKQGMTGFQYIISVFSWLYQGLCDPGRLHTLSALSETGKMRLTTVLPHVFCLKFLLKTL